MATQHFTELKVWQKAHALTLDIYGATKSFPKDERFVLVPQMRRAAISVETNIAEGYGRRRPAAAQPGRGEPAAHG